VPGTNYAWCEACTSTGTRYALSSKGPSILLEVWPAIPNIQIGKLIRGFRIRRRLTFRGVQENYEVQLIVLSMKMNPPNVTPDKFVLTQPPGATVRRLN
jgi:hypothetical protein